MSRFVKAYLTAIHYYLTKWDESITIIKKHITTSDPTVPETVYHSFAAQLRPFPAINGEAVQAIINVVSEADGRAKDLKQSDLFDPRFLDELNASGFIKDLYTEKVGI